MTDRQISSARRRARDADKPRRHRVNLSYNSDELTTIEKAAYAADMTPGAYVAQAALAVAQGEILPLPVNEKQLLEDVLKARTAVNRIGTNLNQIAKVQNSDGEVTDAQLTAVLDRVSQALTTLDNATIHLMDGRR